MQYFIESVGFSEVEAALALKPIQFFFCSLAESTQFLSSDLGSA
jgi:hypothetical protein